MATSDGRTTEEKLMEFFDDKMNFSKDKVLVGRPWRTEELRLKSNEDLHKLWYILLKERNMLLTMEKEYEEGLNQLMPSPERIFKVEESMENVMEVVTERDRAINMLETGTTGEPQLVWRMNELGIKAWRAPEEHYEPEHIGMAKTKQMIGPWINRWMTMLREKKLRGEGHKRWKQRKADAKLKHMYPDHFPDNFGNMGDPPNSFKRR